MNNLTVYIDLDSVLAHDRKKLLDITGYKHYKDIPQQLIKETYATKHFFKNLEKTKICDELVKFVTKEFGKYYILSTPAELNLGGSCQDKAYWIEKNLKKYPPAASIFTLNKHHYSTTNAILLDDYRHNVERFRVNGGWAIKCKHDSKNYNLDSIKKDLLSIKLAVGSWNEFYK